MESYLCTVSQRKHRTGDLVVCEDGSRLRSKELYWNGQKEPRCPSRREGQRGAKTKSALVARVVRCRLFDLGHDLTQIVGLGRLERRKLCERLQVLEPQLLTDGKHIPVILH